MPSGAELWRDSWRRRLELPERAFRQVRGLVSESTALGEDLRARLRAIGEMAKWKIFPASDTPINGPVGPHRIFEWLELPLEDFKAVRRACDCSINDVVLATVTGAVRELMALRQLRPEDLDFRVSTPVNVRSARDREKAGNHVSSWIVQLPLDEKEPLQQLRRIHEDTQALKDSDSASVVELATALHEWVPFDMQAASTGTQNMLVTNVPGPPFPLYLLGARMVSLFAQAPLIQNIGLAVSVLSYDGKLGWGFNADYDKLPDLGQFVTAVGRSFERLSKAAGAEVAVD